MLVANETCLTSWLPACKANVIPPPTLPPQKEYFLAATTGSEGLGMSCASAVKLLTWLTLCRPFHESKFCVFFNKNKCKSGLILPFYFLLQFTYFSNQHFIRIFRKIKAIQVGFEGFALCSMGLTISSLFGRLFGKKPVRILMGELILLLRLRLGNNCVLEENCTLFLFLSC